MHLGKFREVLTPHFVGQELRRRGYEVRHLHSWDDYDRFRRVPVDVDPSFEEHIGRPLSAVPDPYGEYASYAERWRAPLRPAMAEMGVELEEISQTEKYTSGAYRAQIRTAIDRRDDIEAILARHRTKAAAAEDTAPTDAEEEDTSGVGDLARFPYKPYCRQCGRDTVRLTAWVDPVLSYECEICGYVGETNVETEDDGKLVWKVDWPMRWAYEGVDFEPGGIDHATPGSSYTVGKEVVRLYGAEAPAFVSYNFVGFAGQVKMSSSKGGVPTPTEALQILEAPILRWLYVRRQPRQAFDVDFGSEVVRLYDEWDALTRKAADPSKRDAAVLAFERASAELLTPRVVVPFRLLGSVADVTQGTPEVVAEKVGGSVEDLEPRLSKAMTWIRDFVPAEERTTVRTEPDAARLAALDEDERRWISLLLEHLPADVDTDTATSLVYGVPKLARGLALDDKPTEEVKADQKSFFRLLYNLLVDADRGPRLPTLVHSLGAERVRTLLTPR